MLLVQLVDFHFKQHIYGEREAPSGERRAAEDGEEGREVKATRGKEREARWEEGGEKKRGCVRRQEVSQEGERRRECSGRWILISCSD